MYVVIERENTLFFVYPLILFTTPNKIFVTKKTAFKTNFE